MMAAATEANHQTALERAFASKNYKFGDTALAARAQQLVQQLHITAESFANQYDSFALVSDWNMEVTAQRLKMVADYLESEQRKENSRPRAPGPVGAGASAIKAAPQAARPTWEDLPDRLVDYSTPSAKRQALDLAAVNPGTATKAPGTATKGPTAGAGGCGGGQIVGTPQPSGPLQSQQRRGGGGGVSCSTPLTSRAAVGAGTPSTQQPPSAFALRTNQGQVVSVLNDHLPGPAAYSQQQRHQQQQEQQREANVAIRPLGQGALDATGLLFMMEVLETKVHALDERIMDFADALNAATRHLAATVCTEPQPRMAAGNPGGTSLPTPAHAAVAAAASGTPPPRGATATAVHTPGAVSNDGGGGLASAEAAAAGAVEALQHSVAAMSHQPVWVAGRVLADTEGAALNAESLLLEGCRDASGGARVRLDVSCLPAYRVFPGQSVCVYGLNPTGGKFIAQRLVTHVPPPAIAAAAGPDVAAASRERGLSLVVAAGPFCLSDNLLYSPLEELLSYCTAYPPDVLLLLGPFVDSEHQGLATADQPAESILHEQVLTRLAAWRSNNPATTLAIMPAVRDVTALPVLPQPPMAAAAQAVGPADQAVALQNPATVSVGPLVVGACSADVLKALSAAEHSRVPPQPGAAAVERLPALASHVLGQRSFYPLYPAAPGTCLDTSHYSQLQLPVAPDVLLLPSDLAPFAKVLPPSAWMVGGPPGLVLEAAASGVGAGGSAVSTAPVVVVNPGRLSRGLAGGTFAHVIVTPGDAPVSERIRVEVKRV